MLMQPPRCLQTGLVWWPSVFTEEQQDTYLSARIGVGPIVPTADTLDRPKALLNNPCHKFVSSLTKRTSILRSRVFPTSNRHAQDKTDTALFLPLVAWHSSVSVTHVATINVHAYVPTSLKRRNCHQTCWLMPLYRWFGSSACTLCKFA